MSKKGTLSILIVTFLTFPILSCPYLSAEWADSIYYGIGNLVCNDNEGHFLPIPSSPYIAFYTGSDIIIMDSDNMKIRGGIELINSLSQNSTASIPDPISGWNIYYHDYETQRFSKLHIDSQGQFGKEEWFTRTTPGGSSCVGVPKRSEVWFFADKILRLNGLDDTWTEFDYPQGWDSDFEFSEVFPLLAYNSIIGIANGKTIQDYQAFILDVETGNSKLINAEKNFFQGIFDIKPWNEHPGIFFIMKREEIYSFNSFTDDIELLFKDFGDIASNVMQDKTGKYLYTYKNSGLYELNLDTKTVEFHELVFDENYEFGTFLAYSDKSNQMIASALNKVDNLSDLVLIDITDFSIRYLDISIKNISPLRFLSDEDNKLFLISDSFFYVLKLESGETGKSIPIIYYPYSWNIIDDLDKPILLDNHRGSNLIRILPNHNREVHKLDFEPKDVCQFPDGKSGIISKVIMVQYETGKFAEYHYYDYDFENRKAIEVELPYYCQKGFIADAGNNQIIGMDVVAFLENNEIIYKNIIQFIGPDFSITHWISSEGSSSYFDAYYLFDDKNSLLWLYYKDLITKDLHFYKLSTKTKSQLDSFVLDKDLFSDIKYTVLDPGDRFLYFIDQVERESSGTCRDLVILDTSTKEITKRIILQENIEEFVGRVRDFPGIVPIPEKNKLFIWDHYGAWSIDTNTWEILYGSVKDNPRAFSIVFPCIEGVYSEEKNQIILVDYTTDIEGTGSYYIRGLYIDLDTGNVQDHFNIPAGGIDPHFTKDKKSIIFRNFSDAKLYMLNLEPTWSEPATIELSTSYVQFGSDDNAKFNVNVKNPYNFEQKATAYIWLYTPGGNFLFFDGAGLTTQIKGIPLSLPANLDVTGDILTFTMPSGVPEGYYNFNAVFINENGDRGPIGTWNFYVKD
jgi:hypothetical protein